MCRCIPPMLRLAFILSEANHCKVSVQDWALRHQQTLATLLQQELRPAEFSDDRLGIVLRRLHEADWAAVEKDLWLGTCEVYDIPAEGIRLERQFAEVGVEVAYFSYTQVTSSSRLRRTLQNIDELAKNATGRPTARLAA